MEIENKRMISDIYLDGFLSSVLRDHQKEGVRFLVKCVSGMNDDNYKGAILADSMGLGKSIQIISALWILFYQNPFENRQTIRKCLIVCPLSLINNWNNEINKWLVNKINVVKIYNKDDRKQVEQFIKD